MSIPGLVASAYELEEYEDEDGKLEELTEEQNAERASLRSDAMVAAYLSLDRPELLFSVKEVTRGMSNPQEREVQLFKRIVRYLKRATRMAQRFDWQPRPSCLDVNSDSDFAGCRRTRKSTSGVAIMMGKHCIITRCKSQSVFALSSGEAELYAAVLACSMGLGAQQLYQDLGVDLKIQVLMNATAGVAMMRRQGLGNAKHIATQYLWVQERIYAKDIERVRLEPRKNWRI